MLSPRATPARRLFFIELLSLSLILFVVATAFAGSGKIAGSVRDARTGKPLPDATVRVAGSKRGAVCDDDGSFFILNVPPGVYAVRASYVGYADVVVNDLRVSLDLTSALHFELSPTEIRVKETVVRAERPIVDKNATNAVRIIGGPELEALPFRGVQNALAIQAGVVDDEGRLHVRGSRADEVAYFVDGANVRNPVTGFSAVTLIDEALQEVQLQAGGFNAEYGGANGGIVLQELRTAGAEWDVGFVLESDRFASKYKKQLGTYSYGYGGQVLTLSGPVLGNQNVRALVAAQRRVRDSRPVFWKGFEFENLVDTGDRGGRIHWSNGATPDTVRVLRMKPGNIDHTGRSQVDLNTNLLFDYQPLQLRVTGLYSFDEIELNPAPVRNMLNTGRLPLSESSSGLLNLKATHVLDASTFLQLQVSFYKQRRETFDSALGSNFMVYNDTAAVARVLSESSAYARQGAPPQPFDFNGFPFSRPGTPTSFANGGERSSAYSKEDDTYKGLGASATKQHGKHQVRAGFDLQRWTSRRYLVVLSSLRSGIHNTYPHLEAVYNRYYAGEIGEGEILGRLIDAASAAPAGEGDLADFREFMRNTSRGDFFGYDEFGRQTNDSGLGGPRHPLLASAYLQDKLEYDDLIVQAGLRWDYFDADSWRFVDPSAPVRDQSRFTAVVRDDSVGTYTGVPHAPIMRKTRSFADLSPRLGLSFPVSDRTVFHVQYGRFSQMPAMRSMFRGGTGLAVELGGQNFIPFPTAFDVEPVRTTQYEIGVGHQFHRMASFDLTGFYRDVKGQLQLQRQELSSGAVDASPYNFLQNGDFATTRGLELVVRMRRTQRWLTRIDYTLSDARGTGSTLNSAVAGIENNTNLPTVVSPLDFNQRHKGSLMLDYRFAANQGGPLLQRMGLNLLMRFTSGHNYTLFTGSIGQRGPELGGILASDDPRSRQPLESINSSTTPWTFNLDLKIDREFGLLGSDATAYVYVQNLLNRKNVINVYGRTGNDRDDGFLTDPDLSSRIVEANGGEQYRQFYEAINLDNRQHYWFTERGDIYATPRQIRFGVKVGI
jgi:hypothetical protein